VQQRPGGAAQLDAFERTWFYSDSLNDLPLLDAVSDPVAVRPDARLRQHALRAGWRIVEPIREDAREDAREDDR
jgi:phosphoserine phosphatase